MLDSAYVRDHIEEVRTGLRNRGLDPDKALEEIATLETARRRLIPELETLKRQQNTSGDEIARAKRQGLDTAPVQEANKLRGQQIKQLGFQLDSIDHRRGALVLDRVELEPELLNLLPAQTVGFLHRRGVEPLALGARDLVPRRVLRALQSFELGDHPAPRGLERGDLLERLVRIETAIAQSVTDFFDVIADV